MEKYSEVYETEGSENAEEWFHGESNKRVRKKTFKMMVAESEVYCH